MDGGDHDDAVPFADGTDGRETGDGAVAAAMSAAGANDGPHVNDAKAEVDHGAACFADC